jgi:hypothetical protein
LLYDFRDTRAIVGIAANFVDFGGVGFTSRRGRGRYQRGRELLPTCPEAYNNAHELILYQSPVKSQGSDGLCWSFAAMAAIESATIVKTRLICRNITQHGRLRTISATMPNPPDAPPSGWYGKMRRAFLKERRTIEYSHLLLTEKLFPHHGIIIRLNSTQIS